jgi:hypothetical protein
MPPVLGPWSPSSRRLWSWLVASAKCVFAVAHHDEAGFLAFQELLDHDPRRHPRCGHRRAASGRLRHGLPSSVIATTTPLPAARPSALTTIGAPCASTWACAAARSEKVACPAVGMPWRTMKALENAFELSSCAAAWVGPKMRRPWARNSSTTPGRQRALGPHHGQPIFSCEGPGQRNCRDVGEGQVAQAVGPGRTAVAGRHIDHLHLGRLRQLPGQGVLAAAAADHKYLHRAALW